jgi:hypothetical protein
MFLLERIVGNIHVVNIPSVLSHPINVSASFDDDDDNDPIQTTNDSDNNGEDESNEEEDRQRRMNTEFINWSKDFFSTMHHSSGDLDQMMGLLTAEQREEGAEAMKKLEEFWTNMTNSYPNRFRRLRTQRQ